MWLCPNSWFLTFGLASQSFAGLYELGRAPSSGHMLKCILNDASTALRSEITEEIQVKSCFLCVCLHTELCCVCYVVQIPLVEVTVIQWQYKSDFLLCCAGTGYGNAAVRSADLPQSRPEVKCQRAAGGSCGQEDPSGCSLHSKHNARGREQNQKQAQV